MAKHKPEELAADPALAKIYAKYIEPRVAMYKDNLVFISKSVCRLFLNVNSIQTQRL